MFVHRPGSSGGGDSPHEDSGGGSAGNTGASPHLLKHLVLPATGHTHQTPSLASSGPTVYEMKTFHSHDGKKILTEDIKIRRLGEVPSPHNAEYVWK